MAFTSLGYMLEAEETIWDFWRAYIDIDIDCQELLDAIGLDYKESDDDMSQNEVCISLDKAEFTDVFDQSVLSMTNEQTLATALLNHELGEYTSRVQVYTPHGDKITFE